MYFRAQEYMQSGASYHPLTAKGNQFEIKKAKELAEEIIKKYPKTTGAINAKNLLCTNKQPFLNLETEKVNVPNEAFRTLVKYKNTPTLYLRVIKTTGMN